MNKRKLDGLRRLMEEGFVEEAAMAALRMHHKAGGPLKAALLELVEPLKSKSPHAALLCAREIDESERGRNNTYRNMLRRAAKCDEEGVAAEAEGRLGMLYLHELGNEYLGTAHLHAAARLGDLPATYALAEAYASGMHGLDEDLDAAVRLLERCMDRRDPRAFYELSLLAELHDVVGERYDSRALLEAAAEGGFEPAKERLLQLKEDEGPDPGDYPDIPVEFHPDDAVRLRMARNEIVRVFGGTAERAENMIAAMVGYYDWDDVLGDARGREEPGGPFDEDRPAEEQRQLREAQAEIVMMALGVDMQVADAVVDLLRVTSRGELPSLRRLDERIEEAVTAAGGKIR